MCKLLRLSFSVLRAAQAALVLAPRKNPNPKVDPEVEVEKGSASIDLSGGIDLELGGKKIQK